MKVLAIFVAFCTVAFGSTIPRLDGRIFGGADVNIENYPYQVSVRFDDQHICGGTILDKDTILTSNLCTSQKPHDQFSIRVGNTKHNEGKSYKVAKIRENPNFSFYYIDYDVCILKLETSLEMSKTVQPIELHPSGVVNSDQAWVSGWGVFTFEGTVPADILRVVDMKVITNIDCKARYGTVTLTDRMFCAETTGHGACYGDVGGPVVVAGKLAGVVTFGVQCDISKYPGVFANVHSMANWIESNRH